MFETSIIALLFFCLVVTCLEAGSRWLRRRRHISEGGGTRESSQSGQ